MKLSIFLLYILECDGGKGCSRDAILQLERSATSGDRRDAARSACDAENDGIALFLDFLP